MSLLDAYATDVQYRARTGDQTTGTNATLNSNLLSVSRLLERALWLAPGAFNSHTGTYVFNASGGTVLRLRDRRGYAYFLQSVPASGIGVDSEADGTYDGYLLDFAAPLRVRGLPENAVAGSEPFEAVELLSHLSTSTLAEWPNQLASVRFAACTFGWPAVPGTITDLVCHRTHELREAFKDGGVGELPAFDGGVPMRPQTAWLWKEAEALYGRKIPAIA